MINPRTYFERTLQEDIDLINALILSNKIHGEGGALELFSNYLKKLSEPGYIYSYQYPAWWRSKFYDLGKNLKNGYGDLFLNIVNEALANAQEMNKEVLEFIKSEIHINYFPPEESKKYLESLISKYPTSGEFRQSYAHILMEEEEFVKAISNYRLALKTEPENEYFKFHVVQAEYDYLNQLIKEGKYQSGKVYLEELLEDPLMSEDRTVAAAFLQYQARYEDLIFFQNKLTSLETEFKTKITNELENERKRIIEVVGFFSAIIAFILSTVSIGKQFSFIEAIYFVIALGLILILFTVSLSILFTSKSPTLIKDRRFWILIGSLIVMLAFVLTSGNIALILGKLNQ